MQNTCSMKQITTLLILILFVAACGTTNQYNPNEEEWISLFNEKDLSDWDIKIAGQAVNDNYLNTFRIEDSMLRISYEDYDSFGNKYGHLYSHESYSYYKLRFEYRFVGEQTPGGESWNVRNSGIMLHSQSARSLGFDQFFPVSIELQLLGGLGERERTTGNLCTPGTNVVMGDSLETQHVINSQSKTYHGDQWIAAEAVVYGDSLIHHLIEDDTVLTYVLPQIDSVFIAPGQGRSWDAFGVPDGAEWAAQYGQLLSEGHIALQAESHPIDFRNIRLLNLAGCRDPKANNYRSWYVKHLAESCTYD